MNTKQRTAMIFVLLMSLAISSCAPGQLFGSTVTPTPTSTLTPTSTPIPPTSTSTPVPTDTPTLIPNWKGMIPIMPGATNGQDLGDSQFTNQGSQFTTGDYQFTTTASETDIVTYYEQEMAKLGWELHPDMMTEVPGTALAFQKGSTFVFFKIDSQGSNNDVLIHMIVQQ